MNRHVISLLVAAALATVAYCFLHYLYTTERITFDVSDAEGHGPDSGGEEWRGAVRSGIPGRCFFYGSLVGVGAFALTFRMLRPRHEKIA